MAPCESNARPASSCHRPAENRAQLRRFVEQDRRQSGATAWHVQPAINAVAKLRAYVDDLPRHPDRNDTACLAVQWLRPQAHPARCAEER
jgi:hypothetical protein